MRTMPIPRPFQWFLFLKKPIRNGLSREMVSNEHTSSSSPYIYLWGWTIAQCKKRSRKERYRVEDSSKIRLYFKIKSYFVPFFCMTERCYQLYNYKKVQFTPTITSGIRLCQLYNPSFFLVFSFSSFSLFLQLCFIRRRKRQKVYLKKKGFTLKKKLSHYQVLLMGRCAAGKTSMRSIIFHNNVATKTRNLEPTSTVYYNAFDFKIYHTHFCIIFFYSFMG